MRSHPLVSLAAALLIGCGGDVDPDAPQPGQYGCYAEGDSCWRDGYTPAGNYEGTCRVTASGASWECCGGCWDAEQALCQSGAAAPLCGTRGEECAADKCG